MILQVHEIEVKPIGIDPDPKVVRQNDVVAWNFEDLVESDVREVKTDADVKEAESAPVPIIPRLACFRQIQISLLHNISYMSLSSQVTKNNMILCVNFLWICVE